MVRTDRGLALIKQYQDNNGFINLLTFSFSLIGEGIVEYAVTPTENHLATPDFVHGGVLTTLLDATMGAGALTLVADDEQVVSTIEMQVNFIQAAKLGEHLCCRSFPIRKGKKVIFMKAEIRNEQNNLVAVSNGSFYPFPAAKAGYKFF